MIKVYCKNCDKEINTYSCRKNIKIFCSKSCRALFHKERWFANGNKINYGKHHSKLTKKKIGLANSISLKGNKINCGKKNHFWKGGISSINKKIKSSIKYKDWRNKVFTRDNWTCQECGKRGGIIHAHHIKPFSLFFELRFLINNGKTLCIDCHKKTDTWSFSWCNKKQQ
jgi:5-methylcytosine-specific restriction endonuclease McrA